MIWRKETLINNLENDIFEIIVNAGQGKAFAYEALEKAENNNFEDIEDLFKKSDEFFTKAHNIQTKLMQKDLDDDSELVSLLMVHAQDQLMTALESRDLIKHMINMYKIIYDKQ